MSATSIPKVLAEKKIEDIGKLDLETQGRLDLSEVHGEGLPGPARLDGADKPECIQALSTPETAPNGRFLDYPADWGSRAATILADNNMPLHRRAGRIGRRAGRRA